MSQRSAVVSHWQQFVRFDRPEIGTSDLPSQRRTRYRSTNLKLQNSLKFSALFVLSVKTATAPI